MRYHPNVFHLEDRAIQLMSVEDSDEILSLAAEGKYIDPYWGKVWDSAVPSSQCLLRSQVDPGIRTLEIGCGCGLLGIAGLIKGLQVTFSDHEPAAVELACRNARLNGFEGFGRQVFAWDSHLDWEFDMIIASDVLYDENNFPVLLEMSDSVLKDGGSFRLGDPGRRSVSRFLSLASDANWKVGIFDRELEPVTLPAINQFQWIVLSKPVAG
ncbi:MAG: methyltransferase domain-containing protein [Planctomycetota bacterium]